MGIGVAAPAPFRTLLGEHVPYGRARGVTQTTDLLEPERLQGAVDCAEAMMKAGACVIAFSCTGFSTIRLAPVLRERLGCVAIDAVDAAGMLPWR
jgi:Asp/Glu/hydantoin racemase